MADRTRPHRLTDLVHHDRATIDAILDEALTCHVGFVRDGHPVVIPTIHARIGDTLYLHGSVAAGNLREMRDGIEVCLTATIVDGIVAARSLFNSSMNYRSVVVFGRARPVTDPGERTGALRAISEHVLPGRWDDARHASRSEDLKTMIVAIAMEEASAKVSVGPSDDDDEDLALSIWAGVIPLETIAGVPVADPHLRADIATPDYIARYRP